VLAIDRHDLDALLGRARALLVPRGRRLLGVTGPPGAGKSTVAEAVVAAMGADATLVGMDGFHLADDVLRRQGTYERKGAPETFDVGGYVHLLARLRAADEAVVYAPRFHREIEAAVAGAIPVSAATPLVVTEGNYLLLDGPGWSAVAGLLDEVWYVDPGEDVRLERLTARHEAYGRPPDLARARALGSDQANAELVARTRERADVLVTG